MDSLTGQVLIILGIIFSLAWAWNKIRKLEAESRDHFKQIDDLSCGDKKRTRREKSN